MQIKEYEKVMRKQSVETVIEVASWNFEEHTGARWNYDVIKTRG